MHSIIFAKQTRPALDRREVRVTEKVQEKDIQVYSRRRSLYKVLSNNECRKPVYEYDFKPQMYIYRNIKGNRKFFSWRIVGLVKIPQKDNKFCLLSYQHSFWMLIKDTA
ncbi:MAG: hypothetical protein PHQ54_01270 [Candidatus Omnitrophica bacterium]|nr:hypothetical protein [Candidatus Omnitrophota bacterium]